MVELRSVVRERPITLRWTNWHRRRGKKRACKYVAFTANPFEFERQLKRNGQLSCPEEDISCSIKNTFGDGMREQDLGHCTALISPPEPCTSLNINISTLKGGKEVIKTTRTASAPGASGVPYKAFKHCPCLLERLWKIFRRIWKKGKVPQQWKYA